MKKPVFALSISLLFAFFPLLTATLASWFAELNSCVLNEGGVNACIVMDHDIGGTLHSMLVSGWLSLLTWPSLGLLAATVSTLWLLVVGVDRLGKRRAAKKT
ncbi:hypothetical protein [Thiomicrorhabdus heinhorstiae]|uniref:PepSY domain-containing protein n=1 Tax=Thiomicrorhabdus heinhorstiae TaxID=2748010 RepID=A0ABS0BYM2_9GAMM|nr:hypothetical protein [Thiomicrorhabdus heinhorstiae]MBF6057061.1 hypothetical protein [Thiomicrorhabdus heinhorstiae]